MNLLAAPAAYLAILLLVFGRFLFTSHALAGGDWTFLVYPFYQFSRDVFLAEGRLPFWNDLILGGMPHLSSLNVFTLYPTELLSFPLGLSSSTFYAMDLIAHLAFAGSMFAFWMRYRGLSSGAAFVGGLVWMLGAHSLTLAGAGHIPTLRCLAWLPAVFYMLERGGEDGRLRWFMGAGAGLGLCVLTIAVQFVAYAVPVCAAISLYSGNIPVRRRLLGVAVFIAFMCGLSAVVLLPATEYYLYTSRVLPDVNFGRQWALAMWELASMIVPDMFGGTRGYFGPHQFRDSSDYAGLIPLGLAFLALIFTWRRNMQWIVVGAIALMLAMGPATPAGVLFSSVPVYGGFRNSLMWMHFFHLSLCIFAATGWAILEEGSRRKYAKWIGIAILVVVPPAIMIGFKAADVSSYFTGKAFVQAHIADGSIDAGGISSVVAGAGWKAAASASVSGVAMLAAGAAINPLMSAGIPLLAIGADLIAASSGYIRGEPLNRQTGFDPVSSWLFSRKDKDLLPFRVATDEYFAVPNARMPAGINWVSGYHSVGLGRYAALYEEARISPSMDLLSLMNVRYVVSSSGAQDGWKPEADIDMGGGRRILIYENKGVFPRAFLAKEVVACPDFSSVMEVIRAPGWNPGKMPTDSILPVGWRTGKLVSRGNIVLSIYGREDILAQVSMDGAGILVFSETWYPSWKAYVDGKRAHFIRAYGVFRALALTAGKHEVRMLYDPWLFKIGLWLTMLIASFFAVIAVSSGKWAGQ